MGKLGFCKDAKCPYYKGQKKQKIICKDAEDAKFVHAVHMAFPDTDSLIRYQKENCEKYRNDCPLAQGLNKKWGYDDE